MIERIIRVVGGFSIFTFGVREVVNSNYTDIVTPVVGGLFCVIGTFVAVV